MNLAYVVLFLCAIYYVYASEGAIGLVEQEILSVPVKVKVLSQAVLKVKVF